MSKVLKSRQSLLKELAQISVYLDEQDIAEAENSVWFTAIRQKVAAALAEAHKFAMSPDSTEQKRLFYIGRASALEFFLDIANYLDRASRTTPPSPQSRVDQVSTLLNDAVAAAKETDDASA